MDYKSTPYKLMGKVVDYEQYARYKDVIVSQNHDWLNEWKAITLSIKCCDIIVFARFWDFQLSI
jgi:hypothetical protein